MTTMSPGILKYRLFQWVSGIFLMLMLLWLTISAPFIADNQLKLAGSENSSRQPDPASENDAADWNSFANNTTEEKTESGTGFSEYLHEADEFVHCLPGYLRHNCAHASSLYIAFHGELLSPPPEA